MSGSTLLNGKAPQVAIGLNGSTLATVLVSAFLGGQAITSALDRLDGIDDRLVEVEHRLGQVENRVGANTEALGAVALRAEVTAQLAELTTRLDALERCVDAGRCEGHPVVTREKLSRRH